MLLSLTASSGWAFHLTQSFSARGTVSPALKLLTTGNSFRFMSSIKRQSPFATARAAVGRGGGYSSNDKKFDHHKGDRDRRFSSPPSGDSFKTHTRFAVKNRPDEKESRWGERFKEGEKGERYKVKERDTEKDKRPPSLHGKGGRGWGRQGGRVDGGRGERPRDSWGERPRESSRGRVSGDGDFRPGRDFKPKGGRDYGSRDDRRGGDGRGNERRLEERPVPHREIERLPSEQRVPPTRPRMTDSRDGDSLVEKKQRTERFRDSTIPTPVHREFSKRDTPVAHAVNLSSSLAAPVPPSLQAFPRVHLRPGKARIFQDGNPIVYDGAIQSIIPGISGQSPQSGDEVLICDQHGNLFGRGFFNSFSQYRVRIIEWSSSNHSNNKSDNPSSFELSLENLLINKFLQSKLLRKSIGLPSFETNAYRLINSEGDGLSGLIIDIFDNIILVQSSAYWVEQYKDTIRHAIEKVFEQDEVEEDKKTMKVQWKISESRLKQDGFVTNESNSMNSTSLLNTVSPSLTDSQSIIIKENNIKYLITPELDQKTGFYCDQRDNRHLIRQLITQRMNTISSNKHLRVLDLYCYIGGFAMNAILGGASEVLGIDSSKQALDNALNNIKLNSLQGKLFLSTQQYYDNNLPSNNNNKIINLIEGDCCDVMTNLLMKSQNSDDNKFDVIICDPPKLAPTRSSLDMAYNKYVQINAQAMQLIKSSSSGGGILLTCTCSAAMTQSDTIGKTFHSMLKRAAKIANRRITFLQENNAARDHVISLGYPESNYLTGVLLYVH